jgi:hypothetical protein
MPRSDSAIPTSLASLLFFAAVYSSLRALEVLLSVETDPAIVVWNTPVALFWRCVIAAYATLLLTPVFGLVARRDSERVLVVIRRSLPVVALLLVLQALFAP